MFLFLEINESRRNVELIKVIHKCKQITIIYCPQANVYLRTNIVEIELKNAIQRFTNFKYNLRLVRFKLVIILDLKRLAISAHVYNIILAI